MDSPDEVYDENITPQVRADINARRVRPRVTVNERGEIEVFRRKWIYYFCYCEIGFAERLLGTHIITFTREGNGEYEVHV